MTEEQWKALNELLDDFWNDRFNNEEAIDRIAEILELGDDE